MYYFSNTDKKKLFSFDNLIFAGDVRDLTSWYILLMCRFRKKKTKTILWTHGYYGKESFLEDFVKKIYYGLSDNVLLYGNYAKKLMIANKIANPDKLHVIYNSLDYEKHLKHRQTNLFSVCYTQHFKNQNKNIVFVGRLTKEKRLDMLILAMQLLKKKSFNINATFIGDGEVKQELLELTEACDLKDNIWFFGESFDETTLANMIYNADLCVSPGNVGLTAIHSLSFGTPVITHDNFSYQMPEFEAIELGKTGLFFKHNNVDSLAQTIFEWFKDDIEREVIRKKCYWIIDEKYNPKYQLKVLKSLLD